MENQAVGQTPQLDRAPFHLGGGQVYTSGAGGYDGSGINPGGAIAPMRMMADSPGGGTGGGSMPAPAPAPAPPVSAPPITTPAGPSAPVQAAAPNLGPTAQNPLAPLNNYQAQQTQGRFQAPTFQGSNTYQQGSYTAPQINAPSVQGYNAQSATAPQISAPNYQAGNTQAGQVGAQNASAGQFDVNAFRPFADAVYSEATRQLDP